MSENEQKPEGISEAIIQQQVTTIINSDETQKLIRQKVCSEVKKGLEENKSIITEKVVKIIEDIKIDEALKGKVLEQLNSLIINLSYAPKDVINAVKEAQDKIDKSMVSKLFTDEKPKENEPKENESEVNKSEEKPKENEPEEKPKENEPRIIGDIDGGGKRRSTKKKRFR